jgi:hypothetical protein
MAGESNFAKLDAWRKHPLLKLRISTIFPGFGLAVGAFAVYCAVDFATQKAEAKPAH